MSFVDRFTPHNLFLFLSFIIMNKIPASSSAFHILQAPPRRIFQKIQNVHPSRRNVMTVVIPRIIPNPHDYSPKFRVRRSTYESTHLFTTTSLHSTTVNNIAQEKIEQQEEEQLYVELKSISNQLLINDKLYYTPGEIPLLADDDYDALAKREYDICSQRPDFLERLEEETGLGNRATRVGGRVGLLMEEESDNVETGKRLEHLRGRKMMSLDNAMAEEEVLKWVERVVKRVEFNDGDNAVQEKDHAPLTEMLEIIAEPKMDGLSLSLRYEMILPTAHESNISGKSSVEYALKWGATRGDGFMGEDVTESISQISTIPKTLTFHRNLHPKEGQRNEIPRQAVTVDHPMIIEIRGEIILPASLLLQSKKNDTNSSSFISQFSNARNAASGILRRTRNFSSEESTSLRSSLLFYAYDMALSTKNTIGDTTTSEKHDSWVGYETALGMRDILQTQGFSVPSPIETILLPIHNNTTDTNNTTDNSSIPPTSSKMEFQIQSLLQYHQSLQTQRSLLPFEIDGAVYKLNSLSLRQICGASNRAPRWAIAHKFTSLKAITKILNVDVQVGRLGAMTPVAKLEPVEIGGTMVSKASLHNFNFAEKVLGGSRVRVGSLVLVERAGDVIPQVVQKIVDDSISSSDDDDWILVEPPTHCPACGSPTMFDIISNASSKKSQELIVDNKGMDDDEVHNKTGVVLEQPIKDTNLTGKVLRCAGPRLLCGPRAIGALSHAFSRATMDISGLSDARISQLRDAHILRQPSDLFRIIRDVDDAVESAPDGTVKLIGTEMAEAITALPGWGPKSTQNLATAAQTVANNGISLHRFIYSLGIRHIGINASKLIASKYITISNFFADIDAVIACEHAGDNHTFFAALTGNDDEMGVKGIGPVILASLISFAKEEVSVKAAKDLAAVVPVKDEMDGTEPKLVTGAENTRPFEGMTIVFTGSFLGETRSSIQDKAKQLGAKSTPGSVSKSTDLVVVGEKGGKKGQMARDLGVSVIDYNDFLSIVEDNR